MDVLVFGTFVKKSSKVRLLASLCISACAQCENCMKFGIGSPKMCPVSVKLDNNNVHRSTKVTYFTGHLSTDR